MTLLEPIWQRYCDLISRGDFWALIGKLSVEKADPTGTIDITYYLILPHLLPYLWSSCMRLTIVLS